MLELVIKSFNMVTEECGWHLAVEYRKGGVCKKCGARGKDHHLVYLKEQCLGLPAAAGKANLKVLYSEVPMPMPTATFSATKGPPNLLRFFPKRIPVQSNQWRPQRQFAVSAPSIDPMDSLPEEVRNACELFRLEAEGEPVEWSAGRDPSYELVVNFFNEPDIVDHNNAILHPNPDQDSQEDLDRERSLWNSQPHPMDLDSSNQVEAIPNPVQGHADTQLLDELQGLIALEDAGESVIPLLFTPASARRFCQTSELL